MVFSPPASLVDPDGLPSTEGVLALELAYSSPLPLRDARVQRNRPIALCCLAAKSANID
jgi:hypothetical protein